MFEQYLVESMVVHSAQLIHCPGKRCANVLNILDSSYLDKEGVQFRCECGYYLCLLCREEGHLPMDCETYKQF